MKRCSDCARENDDGVTNCEECGASFAKKERVVAPSQPDSANVCPACGARDDFKPGVGLKGSFDLWVFLFGGLLVLLFHNMSREQRVQCNACGECFGIRTKISILSRVVFWVFLALALVLIWYRVMAI